MDTADTGALDQADMARLAGGHHAALNDLMERHAHGVYHFLFRMLGNEDDANDLAQETFVRVFQNCRTFRSDSKFTTWLYTIAGNLARNHYRWRSRHPNVSLDATLNEADQPLADTLPATEPAPNDAAAQQERGQAVRAAVDALPPDLREVIILCEWQDMAAAEAAQVLKITAKAVENRLYRARSRLRSQLHRWL